MRKFIWASYGMYFLGGMTTVLFGSVMSQWLAHYDASYTTGGLLIFLQAVGFMTGVPLVSYFMNRYKYQHILTVSALAVAVAQLALFALPDKGWVFALVILNGMGASALETAVASYVMELFAGQRAVFMSRLEVSFGLGALGMPAFSSLFIALGAWRVSFLVMGLFALLLAVFWQRISFSLEDGESVEQLDARTAAPPEFRSGRAKYGVLFCFLLMIFIYVGVEGSLSSFLPSMFSTYLHALPTYASLSASVFWVAMVIGRLAIGWVARRVSYERYLLWSILASLAFLIAITQLREAGVSFAVVFGLGIAMSAVYSITMVYANHTFPGMERIVTSLVTAAAGTGGAVCPAIIGYAMDHYSRGFILWMLVGFTCLLFAALLTIFAALRRMRREQGRLAGEVKG